ncbi:ribonuclease H-like domain-containing protein [Tanacetum coccineum]
MDDEPMWAADRVVTPTPGSAITILETINEFAIKEKMESQSETTHTVSALKLPVLKTMEYDLWSMRMEQYLTFTDHALWEVIVNGDSVAPVASASIGAEGPIPPKTAEQKLVRKNELKAKSILMLAIPDEHLLKFHACKDAKSLWEAIKNRFGGNKKSKKMQKTILKQNYENFAATSQEGLDKTYDRFQNLISQLEIHGEVISQEDANLKLLRNNSSSTNESVNTAHDDYAASSQGQGFASTYADDVIFSFLANQSNSTQLDNEDLEQIDTNDLEEMDLKWQVTMLTMRVKIFIKKTGRNLNFNGKETVGFDKTKVECYNCHMRGHFARECRAPRNHGNRNGDNTRRVVLVETPTNTLVVQDGIGLSSSSSSDSEVHTCSKDYLKSYETLQKQYDQQREALNKSNLEIIGYQMGLESLEARIVVHEKNEVIYEEDIAFIKYDVQVKDISIKDLKNQFEEALKEKDDLKLKLEKFETSSKNLTHLINSQMSAKDKTGLGYNGQMNESDLINIHVNESEVLDRFKKSEGNHAVPPPYTGNYMPPRPDLSFAGLDDSVFKSKVSETITSVLEIETTTSKTSKDSLEKPKTIRSSAPLIEEWESDSEDENVFKPKEVKKTVKANFKKIEFVNARNTTVEKPRKFCQSPRGNKRSRNGLITQRLVHGKMETKDTLSSCSDSKEQDMQQMLQRAKILKGSCLNGLSVLKSNFTQKLEQGITKSEFERAFSHIFGEDVDTFTRMFSQNMDTLEQQLNKETILESNCQNAFRVLKTQFEKIFTSVLIKPSSLDGTYARKDFHAYTGMEPQLFKETILKNFDFIKDYMLKTIIHAQTIQKRLDDKKLQIQECTVQEVKTSNAISEDKALECCMVSFRQLHSHLKLLLNNDLNGTQTEYGFKRAFATLFGQDLETFTGTTFLNVD